MSPTVRSSAASACSNSSHWRRDSAGAFVAVTQRVVRIPMTIARACASLATVTMMTNVRVIGGRLLGAGARAQLPDAHETGR